MKKLLQKMSSLKEWLSRKPVMLLMSLGTVMYNSGSAVFAQARPANKSVTPPPVTLNIQPVAEHLQSPTAMAFPGNGDAWVLEQPGTIRIIRNGKLLEEPLLNLKSKMPRMNPGYEERGMLGIAFHPKFSINKKFYLCYSTPSRVKANHTEVIAEYQLSADGDGVDTSSARIILTQEKPGGNHNGGCIEFGHDGYLYVSFGDGGGQHDEHGEIGNGQNLNTWLGKILRIDINTDSGYIVPKDNPFVGRADVKPEIWAYGFRNVWKFSFDKASGQLFAGEVGQDLWEEVDIIKKGANYGWRIVEASHCHNPATNCKMDGITMPIAEYNHMEGKSVTGGYVYNGKQLPVLKSKYVFADWTGPLFYLQKAGAKWLRGKIILQNIPEGTRITAFGEDPSGELYILTNPETGPENTDCIIYKLVKK